MAIVERAIAKLLYRKLGIEFNETGPIDLNSAVFKLKRKLKQESSGEYSQARETSRATQIRRVEAICDKKSPAGSADTLARLRLVR
jgi:hypothetical protein